MKRIALTLLACALALASCAQPNPPCGLADDRAACVARDLGIATLETLAEQ